MKTVLLHNPSAGTYKRPKPSRIVQAIEEAGHTVVYLSTNEAQTDWSAPEEADLIIAAGGDGTVRMAATRVGKLRIPVAILPMGTANNLAMALGITADMDEIIRSLDTMAHRRLDVGIASSPWGETLFLESAGAGLLGSLISGMKRNWKNPQAPSVMDGRCELRKLLEEYPGRSWKMRIDGQEFSEKLLLAEAMNIRAVGPNLPLAPGADPSDRLLDFIFIKEESRDDFKRFLESSDGDPEAKPPVDVIRGRHIDMSFPITEQLHADDYNFSIENHRAKEERVHGEAESMTLRVELLPEQIEVLAPRAKQPRVADTAGST